MQLIGRPPNRNQIHIRAFLRSGRRLTFPWARSGARQPLVNFGERVLPQIPGVRPILRRRTQICGIQTPYLRQSGQRWGRRHLAHRRRIERAKLSCRKSFVLAVTDRSRSQLDGRRLHARSAPDPGRDDVSVCGTHRSRTGQRRRSGRRRRAGPRQPVRQGRTPAGFRTQPILTDLQSGQLRARSLGATPVWHSSARRALP